MSTSRGIFAGALICLCVGVALPAHAVDGQGLTATAGAADNWSPWQGRVSFAASAPAWRSSLGGFESGGFTVKRSRSVGSLHLLGDYFFTASGPYGSESGGLRATSGLIIGPRTQLSIGQTGLPSGLYGSASRAFGASAFAVGPEAAGDTATLPYVGVGYTGPYTGNGWSISADLGLVGPSTGSAAGRLFGSGQRTLDEATRQLRPMPLLQVGASYSF